MAKQKGMSVKGLENIGQLVARNPDAAKPEATKKVRLGHQSDIVNKTMEKLKVFVNGSMSDLPSTRSHNHDCVVAAVREAYNLGHGDALDQNHAVEGLLEQQYTARTQLALPAAVAAIMEQTGLDNVILDLPMVATVFSRCRLEQYASGEDGDPSVIEFKLHHLADDVTPTEGEAA